MTQDLDKSLFLEREHKAIELKKLGYNPYNNNFKPDLTTASFIEKYISYTKEELLDVDDKHAIAGRVMAINTFGKAAFIRIQDRDIDKKLETQDVDKLQIYIRQDIIGEKIFQDVFKRLDIGDFIGVIGTPMRTKTQELTLKASKFILLTKSLRPLPEKWHGLKNVENRYRQRYLDLVMNANTRRIFRMRSNIINSIRRYFIDRDFIEVETPMMHSIAGGATARPFKTYHNTLHTDLFLRIAPELYLKRLVVGGFERVFEINRNFRNEGISTIHNPEFTMIEFYEAYTTYLELMDTVEELFSNILEDILKTTSLLFKEHTISFKRPFKRMRMLEAIFTHGGPCEKDSRDPLKAAEILKKEGVGITIGGIPMNEGQLVLALFEHFAEKKLIEPTFIYDFPTSTSPLSRKKDSDPWFVDRFELFIAGNEIANAFSELNDPKEQRIRFESQDQARKSGDVEAHQMDADYLLALEHGMPPTGGCGIGIDRLVMLFTGETSIREVILFPQLRVQNKDEISP